MLNKYRMKNFWLVTLTFLGITSLSAQQKDVRTREYITPVRIMWQQDSEQITGIENLLRPGKGQADLTNQYMSVWKGSKGKRPAILVDFGKEMHGGIQLVTGMPASHSPVHVRVRLGESVSEAMCDIDGKNGATNDHAMRDMIVEVPWLGVTETGNSGFRFARIDLLDDTLDLHLKEIRAISIYRDIPYKGSFICNDQRLNEIWKTGAYTVHLNMQDYIWDGIKRDRLVWIGDLHPEVMTVNSVFGYNEVIPKSLDLARDITPLPNWISGMSPYSIWWLLIQKDWYYYQGDMNYLKLQKEYITGLLKLLISKIDNNGRERLKEGRFLDWPSSENSMAIDAGLQALMSMGMNAGETLCSILGENELAAQCKERAEMLKKAANEVITPLIQSRKKPTEPGMKQAAALLSLAGLMNPQEAEQKFLSVDGAHGFSTFYGYYMLCAMAKAGNYQGALDQIRSFWGGMLDMGATSFWEDFNLNWMENAGRIDEFVPEGKKDIHRDYGDYCYKGFRHSLCHGWASEPTSWLTEYVLGVQIVEPGAKVVRIAPHLGDLEWAEGTFPTPNGIIKIHHKKQKDGTIYSHIEAPAGTTVLRQ